MVAALVGIAPRAGLANPQGGTVVGGAAAISSAGNALTVKQTTNRAIVNWRSFSIGHGETTRIVGPSSASAILNRVTGGDPSALLGRLQSNGQVYLINPNGIMVGPNGVVDTRGGFIASTLNVPNAAFMQGGSLTFGGGSTATITNLGTIKTTGGDVALIALHVVNGGNILAPDGQALLAGGNEVLYVPGGDSNVVIKPAQAPGGASVGNAGRIAAASAQLKAAGSPYALAVNNTGAVEATGMAAVGGRLVLDGGNGDVETSGALSAPGGTANLTGGRVAVTGSVDVSAPAGGGSIAVQATRAAVVTPTGSLAANATQRGNGGHIGVKSQGATNFAGTASATGGPQGGNGGTAEISGTTLGVTGTVNLKAAKGKAGSVLLDPTDIDVEPGTADPGDIFGGTWDFAQDSTGTQAIGAATIATLLASGNLTLQATHSITVNGAITAASINTLEFESPTVTVNQPVSISGGTLVFSGLGGGQPAAMGQALTTVAGATLAASSLDISSFAAVGLGGAVQVTQLTLDNPFGIFGQASVSTTNAGNAIGTLVLNNISLSGALDVSTSGGLTVEGQGGAGSMAITAAGDLFMSAQGSTQLAGINQGPITLASTGGAFINQVGPNLFFAPTTGRVVIYSATDAGSYTQGLLGFPEYNPAAFGSDPEPGLNQVIYIANSTALPALAVTADALSRTYGGTGPGFTFNSGNTSLSSLAIQPQFALLQGSTPVTNTAGLAAGTYTIVPSGAISSQNALSFTNSTFTVNPAPLNIVGNNATVAFGDPIPTVSATIFGLVNGDPASVVTGLNVTTTATAGSPAANYPITPSGASAANYAITYTNGTLTIGKAALTLTITADDISRLYGAANPTLTASYAGFVNGDTPSMVSRLVLSTTAVPSSPVGIYPILATGATAVNYNIALVNGTLTVTPAPLTITANSAARLYGASNPAFSASYSGFVSGDTASVVAGLQFGTNTTSASPVGGGYAITPSGASASNYAITYATGTLTVNPAPVTITADDMSKTYGAANPGFTASYAGLVNGENSTVVTGLRLGTAATAGSPVGGYAITPAGASAANYTITYAAGTLTVNPAPLTITANDASRLYGAAQPSFSASYSGLVNGDNPSVVTGLQLTTNATGGSNVGAYPITPSGASAANYAIAYTPGTLTVNPAPLTITANDGSAVYGHSLPSFGASYAGFVNGDTAAVVTGLQFVANGMQGSAAGSYSIIPFAATATNYAIAFVNGTLTITPAPLTITADSASRLYGAGNPVFTASYAGLVNGDTAAVVTGLQLSATAANVGTYPIIPSGASAANYAITYVSGALTINPAPLTITADNASRLYGAGNPAFTASYAGLVNGDTAASITGLQLSTSATAASNVGTYSITPSGASATNYAISYVHGTLAIDPAPLTITANASKAYAAALPTSLPAADFAGFVNGDTTAAVVGLKLNTTATAGSNVGAYLLTASGAGAQDYAISLVPGTLTVTPVPLLITANDASRTYGSTSVNFSATFTGLLNGDSSAAVSGLKFATAATAASGVGAYPITPSGASAGNYTISYANGTLTISPAPLTVTANSVSRTYGSPNPDFNASLSGLVNGDSASLVSGIQLQTAATSGSGVGTYAINAWGGIAGPNYRLVYVPGSLTVNPAQLQITANDATRLYGEANPVFTGTVSGLVNGDGPSLIKGLTFATLAGPGANVGAYSIVATQATASAGPNYTLNFFNGTLTITPAPLTITADNAGVVVGQPLPTLTGTFTGLVPGEPNGGFGFATTVTTSATSGQFPISLTGSNPNYAVTFNPGTLFVAPNAQILAFQTTQISTTLTLAPTQPTVTTTQTLNPTTLTSSEVNVPASNITVIFSFPGGLSFGPEGNTIIDQIVAGMNAAGTPTTEADIEAALYDPTTSTATMALLLPAFWDELDDILSRQPSQWTTDETTFANGVLAYVNQQRQAAAIKAENDYNNWYQQQYASQQAQLAGLSGPAYVEMAAILASTPPIPPQDILGEAQAGMTMTTSQAAAVAGMQTATSDLVGLSITANNNASAPASTSLTTSQLDTETAADVGTITNLAGWIMKTGSGSGKSGNVAATLLGGGKFAKKIFPSLKKGQYLEEKRGEKTTTTTTTETETETETTTETKLETTGADITKDVTTAERAVETAGVILEVGGLVTEIVSNVVSIGIGGALYSSLADYNKSFNNTIAANTQPLQLSDLAAMENNNPSLVYTYMMNMIAGGNKIPPLSAPPGTPASVYESL
jgi:filamentous hemagglutinin family protein